MALFSTTPSPVTETHCSGEEGTASRLRAGTDQRGTCGNRRPGPGALCVAKDVEQEVDNTRHLTELLALVSYAQSAPFRIAVV